MIRYYKGTVIDDVGGFKKPNTGTILYKALDVTSSGISLFKCDVTDTEHLNLINAGNTEILEANLKNECDNLFGKIYSQHEIDDWKIS